MAYNSPKALLKGIKADFAKLFATSPESLFAPVITRVNSNSNEEKYWLPESMPGIKEWIDKRHFGDFGDKFMTVTNKDWDSGLQVERNTINDSREFLGGNVEAWVKMLVDTAKQFPDELCQNILDNNSKTFDDTALFATSRSNIDTGSNTINNLLTGTSSSTYSLSEFETDYKSAKTKLLGFRDKNNRTFNKKYRLSVIVPPHMEDLAKTLLSDRMELLYISGTKNNLYAGDAQIIVNSYQAATDNDWYLVNINASFQPFLIQDRQGVQWQDWDDTKSKFVEYGFDFRMGFSALNPFCIVKTNN
jgi:phage major head subunit gpT-like protein